VDCPSCPNHALLTVDTSVLCSLARFCYGQGGFAKEGSPAEVVAAFSSQFGNLIDSIRGCSPERTLSTSGVAFSKEQSVDHGESQLRRELCECDSSLRTAEDADWRPVGEVLASKLQPHRIDVRAADRLRRVHALPGPVDASLVADGLLNARKGKCILLSFDTRLIDAVRGLKQYPVVEWAGGYLQTAGLEPKYGINFVTDQYRRCCRGHMETFKLVSERMEHDARRLQYITEPKATSIHRMQVEALGVLRAFYETKVSAAGAAAGM